MAFEGPNGAPVVRIRGWGGPIGANAPGEGAFDDAAHDNTTTSSAPAVSVQGLVTRYGDVTAVDGVSLSPRPGTVTGILGPNGAGKSKSRSRPHPG